MKPTSSFIVVVAVVLIGCGGGGGEECSISNCNGCCDASGQCQAGTSNFACGVLGNACNTCVATQVCAVGVCTNTGQGATGGGGGSTASGGGTATGGGSTATGGGSTATGGGSTATGGGSTATGGGSTATGGGTGGGMTGGGSTTGGGSATGGGAGPTHTINVQMTKAFSNMLGVQSPPMSHPVASFFAWVEAPGTGTWTRFTSMPAGTGASTIANVPQGRSWVGYGTYFVDTQSLNVDFSYVLAARQGVSVASAPTALSSSVSMSGWNGDDDLLALASTTADVPFTLETGALTVGATSASVWTDWAGNSLIDTTQGDDLWMLHFTSQEMQSSYLSRLIEAAPISLTMQDGATASQSSSLLTGPGVTASIDVNWRPQGFSTMASQTGVLATLNYVALNYQACRLPGACVPLVLANSYVSDGFSANIPYRDPLPSSWARTVTTYAAFHAPLTVSGASVDYTLWAFDEGPLGTFTQPRLSPPTALSIGGQSATSLLTGVGTMPTVSWSPPTIGAPNRYTVMLLELTPNGTQLAVTRRGTYVTAATSMRFPPSQLTAGKYYAVSVRASVDTASIDVPNAGEATQGADTLSQPFTP